ncbi:MAG TPA: DUF3566 domain-containing protein [Mycobacteriales bacterium]|nr:DUF3566 domain-containing protein [Mycobacteriales bacterium]
MTSGPEGHPPPGGQFPGPPVAPRPAYGGGPTGPGAGSAGPGAPARTTPAPAGPAPTASRPAPPVGSAATAAPTRPITVGAAAGTKGGRRARLTVKRIDPWSTLKFSFVYSLAGLIVLLVAVVALYAIVDAMGVIDSIRTFLNDVEGSRSGGSIADWLGFGRVLLVAFVVGIVNVILFTAFATVTAFIYNVCTDVVGGVEVTLADRN